MEGFLRLPLRCDGSTNLGDFKVPASQKLEGYAKKLAAWWMERLHSRCKQLLSSRSMSFWMRAYRMWTLPLAPRHCNREVEAFFLIKWTNLVRRGMSMAHPARQILKPKAYKGAVQKSCVEKNFNSYAQIVQPHKN
jgi:hypothetical protein